MWKRIFSCRLLNFLPTLKHPPPSNLSHKTFSFFGPHPPFNSPLKYLNRSFSSSFYFLRKFPSNSSQILSKSPNSFISPTSSRSFSTKSRLFSKEYLNKFLLKIHPDFFTQYPDIRQKNQESLQSLNSLLNIIHEIQDNKTTSTRSIPDRMDFQFFLIQKVKEKNDFTQVTSYIELYDLNLNNSSHQKQLFERFEKTLYDLFTGAGIPLPSSLLKQKEEGDQKRWKYVKDMKTLLDKATEAHLNYGNKTTEWLKEEKKGKLKAFPEDEEYMNQRDLTFFENGITSTQQKEALEKMFLFAEKKRSTFGVKWLSIPRVITKKWNQTSDFGYFTFPWNFTFEDLENYLQINLSRVISEREYLRNKFHLNSSKIVELEKYLQAKVDIDIKVPPDKSLKCLEELLKIENLVKLSNFKWENIRLFISDSYRFSLQEIQIPFSFEWDDLMTKLKEMFQLREDQIVAQVKYLTLQSFLYNKVQFETLNFVETDLSAVERFERLKVFEEQCRKCRNEIKFTGLHLLLSSTKEDYAFDLKTKEFRLPFNFEFEDLKKALVRL